MHFVQHQSYECEALLYLG
uniref:Zinc phosphodiesterase, putative n=1 Tax=Arundo donax TaxID=35708 RepID=A0A0A9F5R1_ARUDO